METEPISRKNGSNEENTKVEALSTSSKKKVAYFYDSEVGNFHYGETHPMKPHRVRMAHHLIVNYNLYEYMDVFQPELISSNELTKFHSDDYVDFLKNVNTDNMHEYVRQLQRCKAIFLFYL